MVLQGGGPSVCVAAPDGPFSRIHFYNCLPFPLNSPFSSYRSLSSKARNRVRPSPCPDFLPLHLPSPPWLSIFCHATTNITHSLSIGPAFATARAAALSLCSSWLLFFHPDSCFASVIAAGLLPLFSTPRSFCSSASAAAASSSSSFSLSSSSSSLFSSSSSSSSSLSLSSSSSFSLFSP